MVVIKITRCCVQNGQVSTSKPVKGSTLALEGIHHIKCSDSLAPSMLCVSHSITNHILQKYLFDKEKTISSLQKIGRKEEL